MITTMTTIMVTATITVMTIVTTTAVPDTMARPTVRWRNGRRRTTPGSSPRHRGSPISTRSRRRSSTASSTRPTADGAKLNLLRVEIDALADVGSLTPHLGGGSFRYDPLPASLVSHRRRLRFVYFDGEKLRPLTFTDVRAA